MKLTPVELAQDPMRIGIDAHTYDFATQLRVGLSSALTVTHGGTQTHSSQGKPIDRDND